MRRGGGVLGWGVLSLLIHAATTFVPPPAVHRAVTAGHGRANRWTLDQAVLFEITRLSVVRHSSNNREVLDELTREFERGEMIGGEGVGGFKAMQ